HVSVVSSADEVVASCLTRAPDIVLLDLASASGGGIGICRQLKEHFATRLIPVVIIASQMDSRERLGGIQAGCDEFISKPFDAVELHARIRSLVRLKRYTDDLESAEAVILGLGATIEARDPSTQGHCERLARYATTLGRSLGLDQADLDALQRG